MMKRFFALIALTAILAAVPALGAPTIEPSILATPTPTPIPTATKFATPSPVPSGGTPIPTPTGQVVLFAGEVLDVQHGYVFFTTGDAFKLAPNVQVTNLDTGLPAALPTTRMYAEAIFEANGQIIVLHVTHHPLPSNFAYADAVHKYAVALSSPLPNNDQWPAALGSSSLNSSRLPLTGKIVAVRFVVEVPPTTPLSDPVYLATDVSGWNPQAIRMERIDAVHYAVTMPLRTGTAFAYKYTRGAWQSEERGRSGIEEPPRHFFLGSSPLGEPDTTVRDDTVYNWADFNPAGGLPVTPGATPTPFNPLPFGFPTGAPGIPIAPIKPRSSGASPNAK